LLAIAPAKADTPAGAVGKTETEMGLKWLAAAPSPDNHQALVVRLLLQERLGHAGEVLRPLLQKLLKLQNPDGGWSQTKEMPSDPFATGQTLYLLGALARPQPDRWPDLAPAIRRGQEFLVKSQQADGAWPMTSRPNKPGDTGSKNTAPIQFTGSAW